MTLNNSEIKTLTQETEMAPLQTKASFRKFTKAERRRLRGAIRKLSKSGMPYTQMVGELTLAGFTGPGGSLLRPQHVNNVALQGGIRKASTRKASTRKASTRKASTRKASAPHAAIGETNDREALIDLVLQSRLPAAQKVTMIQGLRR